MSCEVHCTFIMYFGAVHLSYVSQFSCFTNASLGMPGSSQTGHEEAAKLWCKHSALPSESKEGHRQKQTRATSCAGFVSGSGEAGSHHKAL